MIRENELQIAYWVKLNRFQLFENNLLIHFYCKHIDFIYFFCFWTNQLKHHYFLNLLVQHKKNNFSMLSIKSSEFLIFVIIRLIIKTFMSFWAAQYKFYCMYLLSSNSLRPMLDTYTVLSHRLLANWVK